MAAKRQKSFDLSSIDDELQDVMLQSSPQKLPPYINGYCKVCRTEEDCGCGCFCVYCSNHDTYFSWNTFGCKYCAMGQIDTIKMTIAKITKWPMPFIIEVDGQYFFNNVTQEMYIIGKHYFDNHTGIENEKRIRQKQETIHRRMTGLVENIDSFVDEFDKKLTVQDDKEFDEFVDDFINQCSFNEKPFIEDSKGGDDEDISDQHLDFSEQCAEEVFAEESPKTTSSRKIDCKICMQDYNDNIHKPLILECGHTFCRFCLLRTVKNDTIECGVCRFIMVVKLDLKNLKTNYDLIDQ